MEREKEVPFMQPESGAQVGKDGVLRSRVHKIKCMVSLILLLRVLGFPPTQKPCVKHLYV